MENRHKNRNIENNEKNIIEISIENSMKNNIEKGALIEKIVSFCFDCGVFDKRDNVDEIKAKIDIGLEKADFVESLISTIIFRVRVRKDIDVDKLKEILIELEKIRVDLEYKDMA